MERGVQRTCIVIHVSAMININKDALHHLHKTCIFSTASVTTRSKLEQRDGVLWPDWSFWIARIWGSKITCTLKMCSCRIKRWADVVYCHLVVWHTCFRVFLCLLGKNLVFYRTTCINRGGNICMCVYINICKYFFKYICIYLNESYVCSLEPHRWPSFRGEMVLV